MRTLKRWLMPAMVGVVCGWVTAQEVDLPSPDPLGWRPLTSVSLMGGYKDNVTLSSFESEGGPYVGVGLDAFLWRPVGERLEFEGFVLGEHREFFGLEELDREQLLFGLLQMRHGWNGGWRGVGAVEYLYQDQVLDVSATEAVIARARVRGHSLGMRPSVRRTVGRGWVDLQVSGIRQWFAGFLDDYWQVAPRVSGEWPLGKATEVGVSYEWVRRWFDEDEARTADGELIPGTRRIESQHEVGWLARHHWGEGRRWRLTARVTSRLNRDEANGYSDYVRPQAGLRLRYRRGVWEGEIGGRAGHYAYRVQQASPEDRSRRHRWDAQAEVRVRRNLTDSLRVVAEYRHDQTWANRAAEEYSVNTVSGGLEWDF